MRHLPEAVTSDWHYRLPERFRFDSAAANAAEVPSPDIGAGSDRPSSASAPGELHTDEGEFHRGRVSPFPSSSLAPVKPLSRRDRLTIRPTDAPVASVPTGHLSLIGHLRGESGGSSGFERPDPRFGEVPGRGAR